MRKTDLLMLNRSFFPDRESAGQYLTALAESLSDLYDITVVAGRSYASPDRPAFRWYRVWRHERYQRIRIVRVRHPCYPKQSMLGRMINWTGYTLVAACLMLCIPARVIVVCTDPPLLIFAAWLLGTVKRTPFVLNCNDLYPDVAVEMGKSPPRWIVSLFDKAHIAAMKRAERIVCLSERMKQAVCRKGIPEKNVYVIPLGVDTAHVYPVPRNENDLFPQYRAVSKFIVLYAGNMGYSQDFGTVLNAIEALGQPEKIEFIFIGEGVERERIGEEIRARGIINVSFFPPQDKERLANVLSLGDVHLVPLKKGIHSSMFPSKLYGILAAGRPYIALTDEGTAVQELTQEQGCGIWVRSGDSVGLRLAFEWCLAHKDDLCVMGTRGRALAEQEFGRSKITALWRILLQNVFDEHAAESYG